MLSTHVSSRRPIASHTTNLRRETTALPMGLLDSLSNFLQERQGDFVKLDASADAFGPGPLLLAYGIPAGILDEEMNDMIEDGAPAAAQGNFRVVRLSPTDGNVLDVSLQEALDYLASGTLETSSSSSTSIAPTHLNVPVLFFSGFGNEEMLAVYNILGREIYEETGGQSAAACAKAVPNAMGKPLRQVLEEISGDHKDAMGLDADTS